MRSDRAALAEAVNLYAMCWEFQKFQICFLCKAVLRSVRSGADLVEFSLTQRRSQTHLAGLDLSNLFYLRCRSQILRSDCAVPAELFQSISFVSAVLVIPNLFCYAGSFSDPSSVTVQLPQNFPDFYLMC